MALLTAVGASPRPVCNQINFSVIVAAVTDSIDTCLAGFLFAVDDNLVAVEVQTPVFKVTNRRFETIVDKGWSMSIVSVSSDLTFVISNFVKRFPSPKELARDEWCLDGHR